jgi:SOS-response transcriptional repressor LexA
MGPKRLPPEKPRRQSKDWNEEASAIAPKNTLARRANDRHKFNIVSEVSAASFYRADKNAMASTTSHPTMTKDATAPAVILAFSLVV